MELNNVVVLYCLSVEEEMAITSVGHVSAVAPWHTTNTPPLAMVSSLRIDSLKKAKKATNNAVHRPSMLTNVLKQCFLSISCFFWLWYWLWF